MTGNYNTADTWLQQQCPPGERRRGATQQLTELETRTYDDCDLVDLEAAAISGKRLADAQDNSESKVANADDDEIRCMDNLRPLPVVYKNAGV